MDSITITREQFVEAVNKCNDKFVDIISKNDNTTSKSLTTITMSVQNIVFCSSLEAELFDVKEGK